jgi:hypothetical protein
MNQKINDLIIRIRELEEEVEREIASRRVQFHFTLEDRRVRFEREVLAQHRRLKTGVLRYLAQARLRNLISAPFIYAVFLPLLLVDLAVTGYQGLCFPLYGIPRVRRRDYFIFDRNSLAYLNIIEKFNCAYCAYATGLANYVKEIVGRTEQYWCPIKHARRVLDVHSRYERFVDFGDAEAYRAELEAIRRDFPLPAAAAPVGANQDGNTEH